MIGVDGRWGSGKSPAAQWLGWQIRAPVIALDLYVTHDRELLSWRYEDLSRVLAACATLRRPVIVEGLCLCQALQALDRDPDSLVWVENTGGPEHGPEDPSEEHISEFDPRGNADFTLRWRQAEPRLS